MSIVGQEFEKLKRFNLSEIYQAVNHEGVLRRHEFSQQPEALNVRSFP